ncbi:hypothetical protein BDV06DRAFT_223454 [Aspergillus oleicola]
MPVALCAVRRKYLTQSADKFENCDWAVDDCKPSQFPKDKLAVDYAAKPDAVFNYALTASSQCYGFQIPAMTSPDYKLCCDAPWRYDEERPVEPSYLWSHYYDDEDDVTWEFSNNFGNNNKDTRPNDLDDNPGTDPYGFLMLDGPPGSINNAFDEQYTLTTRDEPTRVPKGSIVTTNQTVLDSAFDHVQETVLVYCNHPADSKECREIFFKGAEDTIIHLPAHIKREGAQVNIRVDYTNLLPYWKVITDSAPSKRKRVVETPSFEDRKARVDQAKTHGPGAAENGTTQTGQLQVRTEQAPNSLSRRWWGSFVNWVKKMTIVIKTDGGVLPMGLMRSLVLYSGKPVGHHCQIRKSWAVRSVFPDRFVFFLKTPNASTAKFN